jgi:hypothetical protein
MLTEIFIKTMDFSEKKLPTTGKKQDVLQLNVMVNTLFFTGTFEKSAQRNCLTIEGRGEHVKRLAVLSFQPLQN